MPVPSLVPSTAPSRPRRVLIVVPAFNEQGVVGDVVRELARTVDHDVLVVDDGSADRTSQVATAAGARVLTLPFNIGVGGAMRTGFRYAVRKGYDGVVQVDADGQHDPAFVPELIDALAGADVVIGARFAGVGGYSVGGLRRAAMRMLSFGISTLASTRLTDVTSGFRASGPRALALFAESYPPEYLGDTVESLVLAHRAGLELAQLPVAMRARQVGHPSQNLSRSIVYLSRAVLILLLASIRVGPTSPRTPG
ncbi:MAG: glycosyltransferase family 2 protein [Candidatus Nanopelagicales bacterium]